MHLPAVSAAASFQVDARTTDINTVLVSQACIVCTLYVGPHIPHTSYYLDSAPAVTRCSVLPAACAVGNASAEAWPAGHTPHLAERMPPCCLLAHAPTHSLTHSPPCCVQLHLRGCTSTYTGEWAGGVKRAHTQKPTTPCRPATPA